MAGTVNYFDSCLDRSDLRLVEDHRSWWNDKLIGLAFDFLEHDPAFVRLKAERSAFGFAIV